MNFPLVSLDSISFCHVIILFTVNVDEWLQSASADNGDFEDIADDQGIFNFNFL